MLLFKDSLVAFWRKTAKTMGHVDTSFKGYQPYEFTYIRDLAVPPPPPEKKKASKKKTAEGVGQEKSEENKETAAEDKDE